MTTPVFIAPTESDYSDDTQGAATASATEDIRKLAAWLLNQPEMAQAGKQIRAILTKWGINPSAKNPKAQKWVKPPSKKHTEVLIRRRNHLLEQEAQGYSNGYLKSELSALESTLEFISFIIQETHH